MFGGDNSSGAVYGNPNGAQLIYMYGDEGDDAMYGKYKVVN